MSYSNNRNDLSGEWFRKPSPPPTPNNRTAWKKIQATWDACFWGAQAECSLGLTLFSALDGFRESQMPADVMLAAAARQSGGAQHRKSLHRSSFSYVELWVKSGKRAVQAAACGLFSSCGEKKRIKKNTEFSRVFYPTGGESRAAGCSWLRLCKVRSRSVRNWSFFLFKSLADISEGHRGD